MPSTGSSFFILGVIMVTVIAAQIPDEDMSTYQNSSMNNIIVTINSSANMANAPNMANMANAPNTTNAPSNTSSPSTTSAPSITSTGNTTSISNTSNITPWTPQKGNEGSKAYISTRPSTTPEPISISQSTIHSTKGKDNSKDKSKPSASATDSTGIIILIVIIIVAVVFGGICYFTKRRGRRYSVDFNYRPDEANIPLSTMEPGFPVDTVPQNGLQTFESTETNAKEPQEPEAKPLVQEEQKAEEDNSAFDPSAESAAPAPSADSSEDKAKGDVVEQSPHSLVEPNMDEKTDDEGIISNKTSVESLKETNENNSNNADVTQKKDWKSTGIFCEVSLDSPV